MATTAEAFGDALRWLGRLLRVFLKRAAIASVFIALFVVAVWWTTRERFSDCGDVTAAQEALLESLREPSADRGFRAVSGPACVEGEFSSNIVGLDGDMEAMTAVLIADDVVFDIEFLPFFFNEWRRCFRFPAPGWERIELNVRATRDGRVHTVEATAPESGEACDSLRY